MAESRDDEVLTSSSDDSSSGSDYNSRSDSTIPREKSIGKYKIKDRRGKDKCKQTSCAFSDSHASTLCDSLLPDVPCDSITEKFKRKEMKFHEKIPKELMPRDGISKQNQMQDIIQKHYKQLVSTVSSCLQTVSNELFSKNLISEEVLGQILTDHDSAQTKASKMLLHIKGRIKCNPARFMEFIDILKEEPSCDDMVEEIMSRFYLALGS